VAPACAARAPLVGGLRRVLRSARSELPVPARSPSGGAVSPAPHAESGECEGRRKCAEAPLGEAGPCANRPGARGRGSVGEPHFLPPAGTPGEPPFRRPGRPAEGRAAGAQRPAPSLPTASPTSAEVAPSGRASTRRARLCAPPPGRPGRPPRAARPISPPRSGGTPPPPFLSALFAFTARFYSSRRPASDRANVTSSVYSMSPPTGIPKASRVTITPRGFSSRAR
jgi:hypothetical protein